MSNHPRARRAAASPQLAHAVETSAARRRRRNPNDRSPWATGTGAGPRGRAPVLAAVEAIRRARPYRTVRSRRYTPPGLVAGEVWTSPALALAARTEARPPASSADYLADTLGAAIVDLDARGGAQ